MYSNHIQVPCAPGELLDKISILEIKSERISDSKKLANVQTELNLLNQIRDQHVPQTDELEEMYNELKSTNEALWDIEDDIRLCEKRNDFSLRFIELARSVYITNDKRAELKKQINLLLNSTLIEEKSYQPY